MPLIVTGETYNLVSISVYTAFDEFTFLVWHHDSQVFL